MSNRVVCYVAPIQAYSDDGDIYPDIDEGMTDLIKVKIEGMLNRIEIQLGPIESLTATELMSLVETDQSQAWNEIYSSAMQNYQQGDTLLSCLWNQSWPYNAWCEDKDCIEYVLNDRAWAGCVPVAGAQIMHYWSWPPYGQDGSMYTDGYDWKYMPDELTWDPPNHKLNAVAELIWEIGQAIDADYGCESTSAYTACSWPGCSSLQKAFYEHFRFRDRPLKYERDDFTSNQWWDLLKYEFDHNQPVAYRIPGHALVLDGWRIVGSQKQFHVNYGHGSSSVNTGWFAIGQIPNGDPDDNYALLAIYPVCTFIGDINGEYELPNFPYRYITQDKTGSSAIIHGGHLIQFLQGVTLTGTGTGGQKIEIRGWNTNNTVLFTRGDQSKGLKIISGHVYLYQNGRIKLH